MRINFLSVLEFLSSSVPNRRSINTLPLSLCVRRFLQQRRRFAVFTRKKRAETRQKTARRYDENSLSVPNGLWEASAAREWAIWRESRERERALTCRVLKNRASVLKITIGSERREWRRRGGEWRLERGRGLGDECMHIILLYFMGIHYHKCFKPQFNQFKEWSSESYDWLKHIRASNLSCPHHTFISVFSA